jgi:hypothetical protein
VQGEEVSPQMSCGKHRLGCQEKAREDDGGSLRGPTLFSGAVLLHNLGGRGQARHGDSLGNPHGIEGQRFEVVFHAVLNEK